MDPPSEHLIFTHWVLKLAPNRKHILGDVYPTSGDTPWSHIASTPPRRVTVCLRPFNPALPVAHTPSCEFLDKTLHRLILNGQILLICDTLRSWKLFSFRGASPPWPPPGALPLDLRWGLRPQTLVIGSRSALAICPPHSIARPGSASDQIRRRTTHSNSVREACIFCLRSYCVE